MGEVEMSSFIALPGIGGPQQVNALKTESQPGEGSEEFYRNGSQRAWSAHGHFSDWLVVK